MSSRQLACFIKNKGLKLQTSAQLVHLFATHQKQLVSQISPASAWAGGAKQSIYQTSSKERGQAAAGPKAPATTAPVTAIRYHRRVMQHILGRTLGWNGQMHMYTSYFLFQYMFVVQQLYAGDQWMYITEEKREMWGIPPASRYQRSLDGSTPT